MPSLCSALCLEKTLNSRWIVRDLEGACDMEPRYNFVICDLLFRYFSFSISTRDMMHPQGEHVLILSYDIYVPYERHEETRVLCVATI